MPYTNNILTSFTHARTHALLHTHARTHTLHTHTHTAQLSTTCPLLSMPNQNNPPRIFILMIGIASIFQKRREIFYQFSPGFPTPPALLYLSNEEREEREEEEEKESLDNMYSTMPLSYSELLTFLKLWIE